MTTRLETGLPPPDLSPPVYSAECCGFPHVITQYPRRGMWNSHSAKTICRMRFFLSTGLPRVHVLHCLMGRPVSRQKSLVRQSQFSKRISWCIFESFTSPCTLVEASCVSRPLRSRARASKHVRETHYRRLVKPYPFPLQAPGAYQPG